VTAVVYGGDGVDGGCDGDGRDIARDWPVVGAPTQMLVATDRPSFPISACQVNVLGHQREKLEE